MIMMMIMIMMLMLMVGMMILIMIIMVIALAAFKKISHPTKTSAKGDPGSLLLLPSSPVWGPMGHPGL